MNEISLLFTILTLTEVYVTELYLRSFKIKMK